MERFTNAGYQQCVYGESSLYKKADATDDSEVFTNYATTNLLEMFAECYTYLMTGTCQSAGVLEDFFPECLTAVDKMLKEIRTMPDGLRYQT